MPAHARRIRSRTPATLSVAAVTGAVLVLPLLLLEWMNTRGFPAGFPAALFLFLWILGAAFVVILMPMLRTRADGRRATPSIADAARVVLLMVIAAVWVTLVTDQMPCFLGFPNCD